MLFYYVLFSYTVVILQRFQPFGFGQKPPVFREYMYLQPPVFALYFPGICNSS